MHPRKGDFAMILFLLRFNLPAEISFERFYIKLIPENG